MGGTAQYEYETVLDQIVNKRFDVCSLIGEVNHMRNIIFLDIDGVLNSNFWNKSHQREISDGSLIDVEKIKLLAELVRSPKFIGITGKRRFKNSRCHTGPDNRRDQANQKIQFDKGGRNSFVGSIT